MAKDTKSVPSVSTQDTNIVSVAFKGHVVVCEMDWLKPRLKEIHKTGAELARVLGIAKARVYEMSRGDRQFQADEIERAARFLEWTEAELLARIAGRAPTVQKSDIEGRMSLRRDGAELPPLLVWKSAAGGSGQGGAFMLSRSTADAIARPDFLEFAEKAFATRVVSADNEPVYRPRDTLLIDPEEEPILDDDCVFSFTPDAKGWAPAVIGRLIRSTPTMWIIRQYAVEGERELPRKTWPNAWRIVGRHHRR